MERLGFPWRPARWWQARGGAEFRWANRAGRHDTRARRTRARSHLADKPEWRVERMVESRRATRPVPWQPRHQPQRRWALGSVRAGWFDERGGTLARMA